MPILRFFAVAGGWLLALLFVADATLKPRGPLFTNNSEGLTRPEPVRTQTAQRAPEAPPKKEVKRTQEAPQPPTLVPASQLAPAAKPVAPPIAEIGQEAATPLAVAQAETEVVTYPEPPRLQPATTQPVNTEVAKTEATKLEPVRTEVAKTEVAKTEVAKTEVTRPQPIRTEPAKVEPARTDTAKLDDVAEAATPTTAPRETARTAPKMHKQVARKPDRGNRYAAYRDGPIGRDTVPTVDNGYAYGVAPGRARAERQQWGGEFGQSRYRF